MFDYGMVQILTRLENSNVAGFSFYYHSLLLLVLVLWLSSLNVKYRDFRYIVPFLVQLGLYISPVGFSSSIVPGRWRLLYSINPMVGLLMASDGHYLVEM